MANEEKNSQNKEKLKALQLTMDKIEKSYGKGSIMKLGDRVVEDVPSISSGSIGLDIAMGVGGYPKGRVIEIYGPESSGKTTLAIHAIAEAQKLTPKAEIEGEMGDSKMGLQARLMSQALRKLTANINRTKTCVIFINQLREKIGVMFGNPETTTGGNALKFYASVRLDIRRIGQIKDGDEAQGNHTRVKVVKNKVAPPFKKAEFDIMYGEGISKTGEIIDLGVELNIIKKSGSWFSYGETKLGQGRESVKSVLRDNPELAQEVEGKILESLTTASTVN